MKSEAKHTPGPWVVRAGNVEAPALETPRKHVAVLPHSAVRSGMIAAAELGANARLIASAPELLALLREAEIHESEHMRKAIRDGKILPVDVKNPRSFLSRVRAAIAKAEGRES